MHITDPFLDMGDNSNRKSNTYMNHAIMKTNALPKKMSD
jgi:hypothetical protein